MNPEILQAKVLGQVLDQINQSSNSLSSIDQGENLPPGTFLFISPLQKVSNHIRDWFEEVGK